MPKLSPTMTGGTIEKWTIKPGDLTEQYQLIAEISTKSLLKVSDGQKEVLEVEIIEEAFLAKVLVEVGETVPVGCPIALFCEDESFINKVSSVNV